MPDTTILANLKRGASWLLAVAIVFGLQIAVWAQQPDPNAPPAETGPKVSFLAYFLTILAVVLGLVIMLRPGSRIDPDAKN